MKEYCIYIKQGDGRPYRLNNYYTFTEVKNALLLMIDYEEEKRKPYYVDNDFFSNKYNLINNLKYFRVEEREVSDWEQYTQDRFKDKNSKIIFLKDFVK